MLFFTIFPILLYIGVNSAECQLRPVKPSLQFRIPHSEFRILCTHLRVCALYFVLKTAENTRISVRKRGKKFLHFSQTFFQKIVDIYQSVWYHSQACECGFGYNSAFTYQLRYAMMREVAAPEAGNFRGVCPI